MQRATLLLPLLLGCAPERVFLRVADPSKVVLLAETPEGEVCVLGPGRAPEVHPFKSALSPYSKGNTPIRPASAERLSDGAITVSGDPILRGDGVLATKVNDYDNWPSNGASIRHATTVSNGVARVSLCAAPWSRYCISVTLSTPVSNVIETHTGLRPGDCKTCR